eukprot:5967049-Prymnesium_polylepis.2
MPSVEKPPATPSAASAVSTALGPSEGCSDGGGGDRSAASACRQFVLALHSVAALLPQTAAEATSSGRLDMRRHMPGWLTAAGRQGAARPGTIHSVFRPTKKKTPAPPQPTPAPQFASTRGS